MSKKSLGLVPLDVLFFMFALYDYQFGHRGEPHNVLMNGLCTYSSFVSFVLEGVLSFGLCRLNSISRHP